MQTLFKILSLAFTLLFVAFALLQINDIDPLVWIYAYLLPAYVSFAAFRNQFNKGLIIAVCIGALAGTITFFPYGHYEGVALKDGMKTDYIEWARESLGLGIVFCAMILHLVQYYTKSL